MAIGTAHKMAMATAKHMVTDAAKQMAKLDTAKCMITDAAKQMAMDSANDLERVL